MTFMMIITPANRTPLSPSLHLHKTESKRSRQRCRISIAQRQGKRRVFTNVCKRLINILPVHQLTWMLLHQCPYCILNRRTIAYNRSQCKGISLMAIIKKLLSLHNRS